MCPTVPSCRLPALSSLISARSFQGPYATLLMAKAGADVIKCATTGGASSRPGHGPRDGAFNLDEMQALTEEAHALDRRVMCHALGGRAPSFRRRSVGGGIAGFAGSALLAVGARFAGSVHGPWSVVLVYLTRIIRAKIPQKP